jgi:hypothetical protein
MQKAVTMNIRVQSMGQVPLQIYQSAYRQGKSTETEMHHVITHIQEAVENRKLHVSFPRY